MLGWGGIVVLLVSALLTAGYLLPVTTKGFFTDKKVEELENMKGEPPVAMLVPLAILALIAVLLGVLPNGLIDFAAQIAASVL